MGLAIEEGEKARGSAGTKERTVGRSRKRVIASPDLLSLSLHPDGSRRDLSAAAAAAAIARQRRGRVVVVAANTGQLPPKRASCHSFPSSSKT
jgi:hypothetical protein